MSVIITGHSDDLIEVDGDVREEFNYLRSEDDGRALLAFSDGTVLGVTFTDQGVWRIARLSAGSAQLQIDQAPEDDDRNYTDTATLDGPISWVVHGIAVAYRKGQPVT